VLWAIGHVSVAPRAIFGPPLTPFGALRQFGAGGRDHVLQSTTAELELNRSHAERGRTIRSSHNSPRNKPIPARGRIGRDMLSPSVSTPYPYPYHTAFVSHLVPHPLNSWPRDRYDACAMSREHTVIPTALSPVSHRDNRSEVT
jgi:hypothetical protein